MIASIEKIIKLNISKDMRLFYDRIACTMSRDAIPFKIKKPPVASVFEERIDDSNTFTP